MKHVFLNSFWKYILNPIVKESVFFFAFFLLISSSIFRLMISDLHYLNYDGLRDLFESLAKSITITYIFTLVVFYFKKKWLKILLYAFAIFLFAVFIFLYSSFNMFIQPNVIILIGETNMKEISGFFSAFLLTKGSFISIVAAISVILIIYIGEKYKKHICKILAIWQQKVSVSVIFLLFLLVGLFETVKTYGVIFSSKNIDELPVDGYRNDIFTSLCYSLYSIKLVNIEMNDAIKTTQYIPKGNICGDSINVVFVIGESYIKSHSQLYGYDLPTTPSLQKELIEGNLFVFDNVVSPYNYTSLVLKNLLSTNSLSEKEKWSNCPFFPAIFLKSGFDVYFWDAQRGDSNQFLSVFSLNSFLYNPNIKKMSYSKTDHGSYNYDDELIYDFENKRISKGKYKLVIFHLWGQHFDCSSRYPHTNQFDKFTVKDIKRKDKFLTASSKQIITEYDNATYYNDFVLNHIINLYREQNTVLLYLSDHGEECYDYRDSKGRTTLKEGDKYLKQGLLCQYSVPFMIWCSNKYKANHPKIVREIQNSLHKPFMTDNVCQVLFYLSGLKTTEYRKKRNLLMPEFVGGHRILGNGIDYDKAVFNVK